MNQLALDLQSADPSYRLIPLTRGQHAIVDATDFEWISQWKWHARYNPNTKSFYAARCDYSQGRRNRKLVLMHAIILSIPKGFIADHINHDTLDNRRSNLRTATYSQNAFNQRLSKSSKSGFKGVAWEPRPDCKKPWRAMIGIGGKNRRLGRYHTPEEAHAAYVKAAKELYGEFACAG